MAARTSPRPQARPRNLRTALLETRPRSSKPVRYSKKGSVCGVRGIRGRHVAPVKGKIRGCGIQNAVRITEVDGIKLSREVLIGCDGAKAFYSWVQKHAKPIVGKRGGGLVAINAVAGYSCRTRNSRKGAKLSEHAKGKAIDIASFRLRNGTSMSVLRDWRGSNHAKTMRALHKSACGPFGTVLGPNSDRFHQDHFHFDIARHRGGPYCR